MAVIVASTFALIPIDIFCVKFLVYNIFPNFYSFVQDEGVLIVWMLYGRNYCLDVCFDFY